jgi:hypothetical protein
MRQTTICLLTLTFTFSMLPACSTTKKVAVEQAPNYQPTPETIPVRVGVVMAPKLVEVQDAVKRVFKDAAVIDNNHNPGFLAGDFNGDASQDLAVILKPAKLDEMNQEFQPWLVRDPRTEPLPGKRLRFEKDEAFLAVIHGYGTNDWRDPEATQTFVLKNAVGNDLKVQSGKEFATENSGRKIPLPKGDLIGETLQGTQGYIYYASSTYAWYDPKTFTGDKPKGTIHQPRSMR